MKTYHETPYVNSRGDKMYFATRNQLHDLNNDYIDYIMFFNIFISGFLLVSFLSSWETTKLVALCLAVFVVIICFISSKKRREHILKQIWEQTCQTKQY